MFWGGDISLRITAVLVLGSRKIDLPIDVSDVQFKFLARLTIKPLIETLPCIGGVTLTLLEEPNVSEALTVQTFFLINEMKYVHNNMQTNYQLALTVLYNGLNNLFGLSHKAIVYSICFIYLQVDFCFRLADSPDLLALPGVPQAVKMAVKIVTSKMLVCPNEYTVPLMPNFGLPSPPQGVLHVRVISGESLV